MNMFEQLAAPFDPAMISWRVGATNGDKTKGLALAYIDARDVMDRLDMVCGPAKWQNKYSHANGKTVCDIGLFIDGEWVWKADGAGDTDTEAEKGALSDAFKRAAVRWGIGRYLYGLESPWVALEARGRSYVIRNDELPRLRALLAKSGEPPQPETTHNKNPIVRAEYQRLERSLHEIDKAGTLFELQKFWEAQAATIKALPADWRKELTSLKDEIKDKFKTPEKEPA